MASVLALLTWSVAAGALALLGWPIARDLSDSRASSFRASMWIGLLLGTLAVLALGLVTPLGSSEAAFGVGVLLLLCALAAWIRYRRRGFLPPKVVHRPVSFTPVRVLALVSVGASVIYLAVAVVGPVTNYDTGLYHFGAINYAHDFSTISGLANLFSPFGYNNSLFPLAAFLGNGPWDGEGFRLINGLFVTLLAIEVSLRLLKPRLSVGTFVLLVSTGVALIPLVALSDFWVISPSSDPAVMILTFISLAYFSDAIFARAGRSLDALVAVTTAVIAVSMRPLMGFFLVSTLIVLLAMRWKFSTSAQEIKKSKRRATAAWVWLVAISFALATVQSIRDYRLSGWLQYPLAFLSFDVPWKAANPTDSQLSTLGYARDPSRMHDVTQGWEWIPSWIGRLPSQWESAIICVLFAALIVVWLLLTSKARHRLLAPILVSVSPAAVTVIVWFLFSPPSFRFAWGPIFGLLTVAIGWSIFGIANSDSHRSAWVRHLPTLALASGAITILGVVAYSAVARLDLTGADEQRTWAVGPITIPYAVTPVLLPEIATSTLKSGLVINSPVPTDQCWARYPVCSPQAPMSLTLIGSDLQSGFMAK